MFALPSILRFEPVIVSVPFNTISLLALIFKLPLRVVLPVTLKLPVTNKLPDTNTAEPVVI